MTYPKKYRKICQEYYGYTDSEMKGKHVHHLDNDRSNNDPLNLHLCTPTEHAEFHPHMKNWIGLQHAAAVAGGKSHLGKPKSESWKKQASDRMKGNTHGDWERTPEYLEFLSDRLKGRTWKASQYIISEEERNKRAQRASERNKRQATCPTCGKSGQLNNMKRWHFEKCKYKL